MLSENFTFNGATSTSKQVKIVRFSSSGFLSEPTIGSASLTEIEMPNDYKPLLQKVTRAPIEFTLELAALDADNEPVEWTEQKRKQILNWLFTNEYKTLIFEDRPGIKYYAMAQGGLTLKTMNGRGYVEITFRTNSPFPYKNVSSINMPGSTTAATSTTITIDDGSAVSKIYPKILLERIGSSATVVRAYVEAQGPADTIGLQNSLITDVNKVLIDSKYRTITDGITGVSLYKFKGTTGFNFPYFSVGANKIFIPAGWKATVSYDLPINY